MSEARVARLADDGAAPTPATWPAATVAAVDLSRAVGFLVVDARGRPVGRVGEFVSGTLPDTPAGIALHYGLFPRRRCLVPLEVIDQVDDRTRVVGLRVPRETICGPSPLYGRPRA